MLPASRPVAPTSCSAWSVRRRRASASLRSPRFLSGGCGERISGYTSPSAKPTSLRAYQPQSWERDKSWNGDSSSGSPSSRSCSAGRMRGDTRPATRSTSPTQKKNTCGSSGSARWTAAGAVAQRTCISYTPRNCGYATACTRYTYSTSGCLCRLVRCTATTLPTRPRSLVTFCCSFPPTAWDTSRSGV